MTEPCDHTSVGMLVFGEEFGQQKILLIERKKMPYGFAPPAGHVDAGKNVGELSDEDFRNAASRELREETGLSTITAPLIYQDRMSNECRRGGAFHYWRIYAPQWNGAVVASPDETKGYRWVSLRELNGLSERTTRRLAGGISDEEWQADPGIEPVWYTFFQVNAVKQYIEYRLSRPVL